MIQEVGDARVHVAVISKGRPQNVERMSGLIGGATWFVPPGEADAYYEAGAPYVEARTTGLCNSRNIALAYAHDDGVPSVQLSDDLTAIKQAVHDPETDKMTAEPLTFECAVLTLLEESFAFDARLAGGAPTSNPFYASPRTSPHLFVLGDFMLIHPNELRFDERLRLKEDYDYTCAHVARYGAVARVGWLLPTFQHRTNAGGAVADRTPELEQEAIGILKEKWGPWIKDNPRRPNEILLRIPRPKGVQL